MLQKAYLFLHRATLPLVLFTLLEKYGFPYEKQAGAHGRTNTPIYNRGYTISSNWKGSKSLILSRHNASRSP